MTKKIFLDLDGVLADFDGHYRDIFKESPRTHGDAVMWPNIHAITEKFWSEIPVLDGAKYFFEQIQELDPIILTSCPTSKYEETAVLKRAWVRKNFSTDILVLPILHGKLKKLFMHAPGDILIDDYSLNVGAWVGAGGLGVKHDGDFAQTWIDLQEAMKYEGTHAVFRGEKRTQDGEAGYNCDKESANN